MRSCAFRHVCLSPQPAFLCWLFRSLDRSIVITLASFFCCLDGTSKLPVDPRNFAIFSLMRVKYSSYGRWQKVCYLGKGRGIGLCLCSHSSQAAWFMSLVFSNRLKDYLEQVTPPDTHLKHFISPSEFRIRPSAAQQQHPLQKSIFWPIRFSQLFEGQFVRGFAFAHGTGLSSIGSELYTYVAFGLGIDLALAKTHELLCFLQWPTFYCFWVKLLLDPT